MPLTKEEIDFLINRNEQLKMIRQQYEPLWEEIATYILPGRVGIGYKPTPGAKLTKNLFDSSAIFSNENLAFSMCGTITPSSIIWAYLKLADDRLNRIKEVMDWLEICSQLLHYHRKRSNFYAEVPELYTDLSAFGQGCMFLNENPIAHMGFNGFYYKTLANSEYCTAEDHQGFVNTVFHEFEKSAIAARDEWGKETPKKILDSAEKEPDKKFSFLHCTFSNENGGKPFISHYINLDERAYVSEKGYYELPFIVPRLRKISGEDYGRGQGHVALPDTRTLNKAKELDMKAWAKDIDPATFEKDKGIIGNLKLYAGGRNVAKDKESIWTLDRHTRYDVTQIKQESLVTSVRQMFYFDQLNLPEKSDMREMEVVIRYNLMQRLLGPGLGRIEVELLKKLVEREFGILFRAHALPPVPQILRRMGVKEIDIEYEGPLARSQRVNDATAIQKLYAFVAPISAVNPKILDKIDDDKAVELEAEALGVPSKVLRSDEEVIALREQRAKAQAAEQQKMDMERLATGIGQVTPLLKSWQERQGAEGEA
ncbi:MAG TPA: portal protein [archaeon]|nr:portal protein [archaeon]